MDRCPKCQRDAGAPNVRLLDNVEEREALEARFQSAMVDAEKRDAGRAVRKFEEAVATASRAVVSVSADLLWNFLTRKRALYVPYQVQISSKIRKPAAFEEDRKRLSVDALLHGSLADRITYAALSLDGIGLRSYGVAALTISEETTSRNATLLEENSYDFVSNHRLLPGDPLPFGHRCTWEDRSRLAVAKLGAQISRDTSDKVFPSLLLKTDGRRSNDEFMEVHIFGRFDWQAIERIVVNKSAKVSAEERQLLKNSRDLAEKAGINWSEV